MKTVGRNAPCPCGSGKKYKNCCLNKKQQSDTREVIWRRLRETSDRLAKNLMQYTAREFGPSILDDAWEDYLLGDDREYDDNSAETQLFIPWMLYSWIFPVEYDDASDSDEEIFTKLAECYLEDNFEQLSVIDREFIKLAVTQPYSFYEILECKPGVGFHLKDLLLETEIDVIEKSGSQSAQTGGVLYGQVIQYQNVGMLVATAPILLPARAIPQIIQLRQIIRKSQKSIDPQTLLYISDEIRNLYFAISEDSFRPTNFVNQDGDLLAPHDIYYQITSPQEVFDQLKVLALDIPEEELFSEAEFDEDGNVVEISFPWLKAGKAKSISEENIVLAYISISQYQLLINVNSEKRAKKVKRKMKSLLKDLAIYQRTEAISNEELLKQIENDKEANSAPVLEPPYSPEIQALLDEQLEQHWQNWLNVKIPILGDISPMEATKTPEGRQMVKALLDDFTNQELQAPPGQSQQKYIDWAREQLGLV